MSVTRKNRGPSDPTPLIAVIGLSSLILAVVGVWAAMLAGAAIDHRPKPPGNPFAAMIYLATRKTHWPGTAATVIVVVEPLLLLALGLALSRLVRRSRRARVSVDAAARHLADRQEQQVISREGVTQLAAAIGAPTDKPGVRIGTVIGTGIPAYSSWEDVEADVWGPRKGKTSGRAVPAILDAPGCVIATSNKRDIVDCTRGIREKIGDVWVFDPQGLVDEPAAWWWDPLSYVTDVDKAARLASLWSNYSKTSDAKSDAYFDPKGEQLLAFLLLAAASAGNLPLTIIFTWATDSTETAPVDILRSHGHELPAQAVQGIINLPDRQRAGVYGTCEKIIGFLVNPRIAAWVTADSNNPNRPRFNPHQFVRTATDTLYLLSREGLGTAGPIVTSLTVATIEAAEELANRSPRGRLRIPLTCPLDEAANTVRWKDLPDLYSHYGSKGIKLLTFLQSWAQGVLVWGENGMTKLWSSANIRVYGGGVSETKFLGDLSQIIGDYEPETTSLSVQRGAMSSASVTTSTRVDKILDVSDLFALPRGRALLLASGMRPVLIKTEQWKDGPRAAEVWESIRKYAPPEEVAKYENDDDEDEPEQMSEVVSE